MKKDENTEQAINRDVCPEMQSEHKPVIWANGGKKEFMKQQALIWLSSKLGI